MNPNIITPNPKLVAHACLTRVSAWWWLRCLTLVAMSALWGGCASPRTEPMAVVAHAPEPEPPTRRAASDEPFDVEVSDGRLGGVLSLPERGLDESVPAVVLVHGSGRMDRNGVMLGQLGMQFGSDFASYRHLAEALREQGIAVLRYDKRGAESESADAGTSGSGTSRSGTSRAGTTIEFESDAVAAVSALSSHGAVDQSAVFVVGHSQGGQLVPWVLSKSPQVAGGILLSAPHGSIDETLSSQSLGLRHLLLEAGLPPSEALARSEQLRLIAEQIALLNPPHLDGEIASVDKVFWYRWRLMSGGAPWLAARLHQPILVISGGNDYNVGARDFELWKRTLSTATVSHEFSTIDCMTHALNCLQSANAAGAAAATERLAPELAIKIAGFVRSHRSRSDTPRLETGLVPQDL